jgi:hypothetical protein
VVPDTARAHDRRGHDRRGHDADAVYLASGAPYLPVTRFAGAIADVRSVKAVIGTIYGAPARVDLSAVRWYRDASPLFLLHAALRL